MKSFNSFHTSGHRFFIGYNLKRIGFGFSIDKFSFSLDFLFFWMSIEF